MSFAIATQSVSLRFNRLSAKPCRASSSRRTFAVRMQASAAAAPPASGEIKDKNAELAINGTCVLVRGIGRADAHDKVILLSRTEKRQTALENAVSTDFVQDWILSHM